MQRLYHLPPDHTPRLRCGDRKGPATSRWWPFRTRHKLLGDFVSCLLHILKLVQIYFWHSQGLILRLGLSLKYASSREPPHYIVEIDMGPLFVARQ